MISSKENAEKVIEGLRFVQVNGVIEQSQGKFTTPCALSPIKTREMLLLSGGNVATPAASVPAGQLRNKSFDW